MPTGIYKRSEELKKQISKTLKRKWKKGLIKVNSGNFKKGNIPWNEGKGEYMRGEKNPFFGKKHTKKVKEINRKNHLGKKHSEESKKKMSESKKGHITSIETRRKISIGNKGKKNGSWQGGKSFELYGVKFNKELKLKIIKRDMFICQECFNIIHRKDRKLSIHHIDYNKKNNDENNLISLCKSCHSKTNFDRKKWTKYLKRKFK